MDPSDVFSFSIVIWFGLIPGEKKKKKRNTGLAEILKFSVQHNAFYVLVIAGLCVDCDLHPVNPIPNIITPAINQCSPISTQFTTQMDHSGFSRLISTASHFFRLLFF